MPRPVEADRRYLGGLDGLRAIAVLAVIAFHLGFGWASGGLLGVGVFFVLSGYLITDLLLARHERTGGLGLRTFWVHRARRLLPALAVMLVVVSAWVAVFDRSQLAAFRGDVLAACLYVSNWWLIFHHVSYFARFGPPSPLGHLWSLAVEEQFYLVWPLLLWLGLRYLSRSRLLGLTLVLALASAVEMAVLYVPGGDPTRVYDGTDTRAFALLIGAALAMVWPSRRLQERVVPSARLLLDGVGGLALLGVLVMFWQTDEYQTFLYRGGMLLLSVLAAAVIAVAAHPATKLSRLLAWRPLRWLGVRSYAIYLWHYPVIVLTTPASATGGVNLWRAALQVGASIGLAALSWRFVEDPIRHGALRRWWDQLRRQSWTLDSLRRLPRTTLAASGTGLVILAVCLAGLVGVVPAAQANPAESSVTAIVPTAATRPSNARSGDRSGAVLPGSSAPSKRVSPLPTTSAGGGGAPSGGAGGATGGSGVGSGGGGLTGSSGSGSGGGPVVAFLRHPPELRPPPDRSVVPFPDACVETPTGGPVVGPSGTLEPVSGTEVTAIGDSIMIDVAPALQQLLPGAVVDAQIGRQLYQTPPVVAGLRSEGDIRPCVVLALGTNGPFTAAQLLALIHDLGPVRQVVLVNVRVPRPWQDVVNATIAQVAARETNVRVFDWYAASAGHPGWFYPDDVHLDPRGATQYAERLVRLLES